MKKLLPGSIYLILNAILALFMIFLFMIIDLYFFFLQEFHLCLNLDMKILIFNDEIWLDLDTRLNLFYNDWSRI